jgi:hypothetical protein
MILILVVSKIYCVPFLVFTELRLWALEFLHVCINFSPLTESFFLRCHVCIKFLYFCVSVLAVLCCNMVNAPMFMSSKIKLYS